MSRRAVSGEHLAIAAHLLLVSLPSKPSSSRLSNLTCRSFNGNPAHAGDDAFDLSPGVTSEMTGGMTATQIQAVATNAGYVDVHDIDIKQDSVEVKAYSAKGQKAKIHIDLATWRVLQSKDESDNHDENDRDHETARG